MLTKVSKRLVLRRSPRRQMHSHLLQFRPPSSKTTKGFSELPSASCKSSAGLWNSQGLRRPSARFFSQADIEPMPEKSGNTLNLISTWVEEIRGLHWDKYPANFIEMEEQMDTDNPNKLPVWFPGGELNLAYNCLVHNKKDDSLAISFSNLLGIGHGQLTYKQLRKKVNVTAAVLKNLGLRKGDTVLIMMSNSVEMVISMLACLQLGIVFKNLPPGLGTMALGEVLSTVKPQMLFIASSESTFPFFGAFSEELINPRIPAGLQAVQTLDRHCPERTGVRAHQMPDFREEHQDHQSKPRTGLRRGVTGRKREALDDLRAGLFRIHRAFVHFLRPQKKPGRFGRKGGRNRVFHRQLVQTGRRAGCGTRLQSAQTLGNRRPEGLCGVLRLHELRLRNLLQRPRALAGRVPRLHQRTLELRLRDSEAVDQSFQNDHPDHFLGNHQKVGVTRCFGELAKDEFKISKFNKKVHDLLKDSHLQTIFIYGDFLDKNLYQKLENVCSQKQIFVSSVHFNDETGTVVAVNDYNRFAEEMLQEGEDDVVRPDNNKVNLFRNLQKNTFKRWRQGKPSLDESSQIVLNAAKNVYIGKSQAEEGLMLKQPLFPTIFHKFFKSEHHRLYTKFYFNNQ